MHRVCKDLLRHRRRESEAGQMGNKRRAGIFIGVDRIKGGYECLNSAADNAKAMRDWAVQQGMVKDAQAKLLTDADGTTVELGHVTKAVREIVQGPGVDQLIIYFAGHGLIRNMSEVWLLSEAPESADQAIDLLASSHQSRRTGIPHVVFISDACRVYPRDWQGQEVRGNLLFPNADLGERWTRVDTFYACRPRRVSLEVGDGSGKAHGVYTSALLTALRGDVDEVLSVLDCEDDGALYVTGPPLDRYLQIQVPADLAAAGRPDLSQDPVATVEGYDEWIARVPDEGGRRDAVHQVRPRIPRPSLETVAARLLIDGPNVTWPDRDGPLATDGAGLARLSEAFVEEAIAPLLVEPPRQSRGFSGIAVAGAMIEDVVAAPDLAVFRNGADLVDVGPLGEPGRTVMLRFSDGSGTVVPVLDGRTTTLFFDQTGALVDIAFRGRAWERAVSGRAQTLNFRRAALAAATDRGLLRVDSPEYGTVYNMTAGWVDLDPAVALYIAYASHSHVRESLVTNLWLRLYESIGVDFFDMQLLLGNESIDYPPTLGRLPLLAQGWSIVRGLGRNLLPEQDRVVSGLRESQWSLYDADACTVLARAMEDGLWR